MEFKLISISKNDPDPDKTGEVAEFYLLNFKLPGSYQWITAPVEIGEFDDPSDPDVIEAYKEKVSAVEELCKKAVSVKKDGAMTFYNF